MHVIKSHFGSHRWLGPLLAAGLIAPLGLAALPGAPIWVLSRNAGQERQAQYDNAAMNAIHNGFLRARLAEHDGASGQPAHAGALAGIRRALDSMDAGGTANGTMRWLVGADVASAQAGALRAAIDHYDAALAFAAAVRRQAENEPAIGRADAAGMSLSALDRVLGQLDTSDEAMLREPLTSARLAGAAFLASADSRFARTLLRSAEVFSGRLADVAIPEGTRKTLAARLATYQLEVLGTTDTIPAVQRSEAAAAEATRTVERALEDAGRALAADRMSQTEAFETALRRAGWLVGAVFLAAVSLALGSGFRLGWTASFHRGMSVRLQSW